MRSGGWKGVSDHTGKGCFRAVVTKLETPEVLGLQLPEILASTAVGESFWELQSKNIWELKLGNHCFTESDLL